MRAKITSFLYESANEYDRKHLVKLKEKERLVVHGGMEERVREERERVRNENRRKYNKK